MPLTPKQEPPYYEITTGPDGTKQYIALLTQAGTNNPGQIIIKDTIGINGWVRNSAGVYQTGVGAIPDGNVTMIITPNTANNPMGISQAAGQGQIVTGNPLADDNLDNTTVIITVYPD